MVKNGKNPIAKSAAIINATTSKTMFMKLLCFLMQMAICSSLIMLSSCGLITMGSSDDTSSDDDSEYETEYDGSQSAQAMYHCPMCQGNLRIQDIYSGEIIECPACEGTGIVTEKMYNDLKEAEEMARQAVEEYNSGLPSNAYRQSSDDIQREINQCQREIDNIERMLQNLDEGSTSYIYYSQQIIQLQYRIRQLELQL